MPSSRSLQIFKILSYCDCKALQTVGKACQPVSGYCMAFPGQSCNPRSVTAICALNIGRLPRKPTLSSKNSRICRIEAWTSQIACSTITVGLVAIMKETFNKVFITACFRLILINLQDSGGSFGHTQIDRRQTNL